MQSSLESTESLITKTIKKLLPGAFEALVEVATLGWGQGKRDLKALWNWRC